MTEKISIVLLDCAESLVKQRVWRFYAVILNNYLCKVLGAVEEDTSVLCLQGASTKMPDFS